MKKLNSILLLLVSIAILSCSSDDDNNISEETSLVGTWNLTASVINGTPVEYQSGDCGLLFNFVVTANQITENEFFGSDCTMLDSSTGAYTFSNSVVSVTESDGFMYSFSVNTLTNTTLVAEFNDPDTGDPSVNTYSKQ